MIQGGWWQRNGCLPARGYGVGRRSFFVPTAKCQALPLACLAPELDIVGRRPLSVFQVGEGNRET